MASRYPTLIIENGKLMPPDLMDAGSINETRWIMVESKLPSRNMQKTSVRR